MSKIGEARKAVQLVVAGVPLWGAASTAENGIDQAEWWALVSLITGAVLVWLTPNDKPTDDRITVDWGDKGYIDPMDVVGLILMLLAAWLLFKVLGLIP